MVDDTSDPPSGSGSGGSGTTEQIYAAIETLAKAILEIDDSEVALDTETRRAIEKLAK